MTKKHRHLDFPVRCTCIFHLPRPSACNWKTMHHPQAPRAWIAKQRHHIPETLPLDTECSRITELIQHIIILEFGFGFLNSFYFLFKRKPPQQMLCSLWTLTQVLPKHPACPPGTPGAVSVGGFEPNVRPTGQRRLQPYFQWIHRCTYIPLASSPPCTQVIAHGHAALSFLNHILLAALFQLLAGKLNWRLPPPTSPSAWCKAHPSQKVRVLCFSNLLFRI